jgi:hypothetical protein
LHGGSSSSSSSGSGGGGGVVSVAGLVAGFVVGVQGATAGVS